MNMDIRKKILSYVGKQKCQGTILFEGGLLILFLGVVLQQMSENKPLRTRWRFWIDCAWRIREGVQIIAGCYDDLDDRLRKAITKPTPTWASSLSKKGNTTTPSNIFEKRSTSGPTMSTPTTMPGSR